MRPLAVLSGLALPALILACGGGDDAAAPSGSVEPSASCNTTEPVVRVILEADTSSLAPGVDIEAAVNGDKDVISKRVRAAGICEFEVLREGTIRLSVLLRGVSPEQATALVGKTGLLEFREPVLNGQRQIVCLAPGGSEFAVEVPQVKEAKCVGTGASSGEVKWKAATGSDSKGETTVLTGRFLEPNGAQVRRSSTAQTEVSLRFNDEGAALFKDITTRFVGFPLAIFVDHELINAPTVRSPITDGSGVIAGVSSDEAKTLKIQINLGALPVPLKVISAEGVKP